MRHIMDRISERITDDATRAHIMSACDTKAARVPKHGSYAVLVGRVAYQGTMTILPDGTGPSNGNLAVLIVRDGHMVTFMWRRDNQPWTPAALRVDACIGKP